MPGQVVDGGGVGATIVIACTIVSACYELVAATDPNLRGISVIDPNILAVKQAEMLAGLNAVGKYRISRTGYYEQLAVHSEKQATELYAILSGELTPRSAGPTT